MAGNRHKMIEPLLLYRYTFSKTTMFLSSRVAIVEVNGRCSSSVQNITDLYSSVFKTISCCAAISVL